MEDTYICNTALGDIELSKSVLGRMVADAAARFEGRVVVTNKRGRGPGLAGRLAGEDEAAYLDIEVDGEDISLTVHLLVRFGTSMKAVAEGMAESLHDDIASVVGHGPAVITVHVVGTMTPKRVIRRDITIRKEYEH